MFFDVTYSSEQEDAMKELRKRLQPELTPALHEDFHMFYRFLKARNFHMEQAESMLRKHLEWRRIMQVDTILDDYEIPEMVTKYATSSILGFDKNGSIIRLMPLGNCDGKGILKSINKYHLMKSLIHIVQYDIRIMAQKCKELGRTCLPTLLIMDCKNLTFAKVTDKASIEYFLMYVSTFQDNFPELIKSIFIINVSVYFSMVFPLVRAILMGPIVEKIKVFGKEEWKEQLLKLVDADVLPVCYGGNRTDPDGDPTCKTTIAWGGTVPESYYLTKNIEEFASQSDVQKLILPRGASTEVKVEVSSSGTTLECEFELMHSDIGIKIFFVDPSDATRSTDILPFYIYDTEYEPLKLKLKCDKSGTYTIVFSNKHAWFITKEVFYRIGLTNSEKEKNQ